LYLSAPFVERSSLAARFSGTNFPQRDTAGCETPAASASLALVPKNFTASLVNILTLHLPFVVKLQLNKRQVKLIYINQMKMNSLSDRLKTRRTELDLSQQRLADVVHVSHVTVYKWENGETEPRGKNLFLLSKALRCSPTWLMYGDETQAPTPASELSSELDERQVKLRTSSKGS
jgi:DNA-binding transcriptional regulator YiaG